MTFFETITDGVYLSGYLPELALWIFAVIIAVLMLKRSGGRAEKLFFAGSILLVSGTIIKLFLKAWLLAMADNGQISITRFGFFLGFLSIPDFAGLICLTLAFILRFRKKREVLV